MADESLPLVDTIYADAPGLRPADLIFVFGTRLDEPARIAAELFHRRLAPLVLVTGGSARQPDRLNEAEHHRDLLLAGAVPGDCVIVENRSSSTYENVVFALPLLERRCPNPRSVIAVVKKNHRRALITLAQHVRSIERIYSASYDTAVNLDRIDKERRYMRDALASGIDPLVADGAGWRRSWQR